MRVCKPFCSALTRIFEIMKLKMPEMDVSNDDAKISHAGSLYVWPLGVRSRMDWYRVSFSF